MNTPRLPVNGKSIEGVKTDLAGRFWRFDAHSLQPATQYELRITNAGGAPLSDAWPLKTLATPDAAPERMRVRAFTCAGGYDGPLLHGKKTTFLDMTARRRLLACGMSYQPDVVISNGDHMTTAMARIEPKYVKEQLWAKFGGELDLSVPMLHGKNAPIFTGICDHQISGLYGTTLRSTPSWFVTGDHDMSCHSVALGCFQRDFANHTVSISGIVRKRHYGHGVNTPFTLATRLQDSSDLYHYPIHFVLEAENAGSLRSN